MVLLDILPAFLLLASVSADVSTRSLVTCRTKLGTSSVAQPKTTLSILTIPWYALKITTYTPVTTITTTTQTVSTAFASTVTTVTSTTTIPAPAGFTPIQSSLPGAKKRRSIALSERSTQPIFAVKNGKLACTPPVYPNSVNCKGIVAVITTLTLTKTARQTRTAYANTLVYTSTTTTTTTDTVQAPQATFYAACGPDNLATAVNNVPIVYTTYLRSHTIDGGATYNVNAYECCVFCFMLPGCLGAVLSPAGSCFTIDLRDPGQCSQSDAENHLFVALGDPVDGTMVATNGPCGVYGDVEMLAA